jgi:hypothetical protein
MKHSFAAKLVVTTSSLAMERWLGQICSRRETCSLAQMCSRGQTCSLAQMCSLARTCLSELAQTLAAKSSSATECSPGRECPQVSRAMKHSVPALLRAPVC